MAKPERKTAPDDFSTELYAKFFSGLANPTRLRIVELLLEDEMSVGELVTALGVSQSQVSNQLACLKWCGYVESRQQGRFVFYSVRDARVREIVTLAKTLVAEHAEHLSACTRIEKVKA